MQLAEDKLPPHGGWRCAASAHLPCAARVRRDVASQNAPTVAPFSSACRTLIFRRVSKSRDGQRQASLLGRQLANRGEEHVGGNLDASPRRTQTVEERHGFKPPLQIKEPPLMRQSFSKDRMVAWAQTMVKVHAAPTARSVHGRSANEFLSNTAFPACARERKQSRGKLRVG